MTEVEKQAAEAAKAEAEAKAKKVDELRAEFEKLGIKIHDDLYLKGIVQERDEARKKARDFEDKEKKSAEAELLKQGKLQELLDTRTTELAEANQREAALQAKAQLFEEQQAKLREQALAKLTDPKLKALAEKFSDLSDVTEFVELHITGKVGVDGTKGQKGGGETVDPRKLRPGEKEHEWMARLRAENLIKG